MVIPDGHRADHPKAFPKLKHFPINPIRQQAIQPIRHREMIQQPSPVNRTILLPADKISVCP
jgi:hypothetical protein